MSTSETIARSIANDIVVNAVYKIKPVRVSLKRLVIKGFHEKLNQHGCSKCDYTTTKLSNLKQHYNYKHTRSTLWAFLCPDCNKRFPTKQALERHSERKIPCSLDGESDKRKLDNLGAWDASFSLTLDCLYNTTSNKFTDFVPLLSYAEALSLRVNFLQPYQEGRKEEGSVLSAISDLVEKKIRSDQREAVMRNVRRVLKHIGPHSSLEIKELPQGKYKIDGGSSGKGFGVFASTNLRRGQELDLYGEEVKPSDPQALEDWQLFSSFQGTSSKSDDGLKCLAGPLQMLNHHCTKHNASYNSKAKKKFILRLEEDIAKGEELSWQNCECCD